MSKSGDVFENPITGEFGYIRVGTQETNGELSVSDLRVHPGGAVLGAHIHPTIDERFTVLSGKIGYMLGEQKGILLAGDSADLVSGRNESQRFGCAARGEQIEEPSGVRSRSFSVGELVSDDA